MGEADAALPSVTVRHMPSVRGRDRDVLAIWLFSLSLVAYAVALVLFLVLGGQALAWLALACGSVLLCAAWLRMLRFRR